MSSSQPSCHHKTTTSIDYLLWFSLSIIVLGYCLKLVASDILGSYATVSLFLDSIYELVNRMWIGVMLGMTFVGLLSQIPKEFVISLLGNGKKVSGIFRATLAGVLLDMCSHGILLVAAKLYERGASLAQVMAFLIASPWNSISLTIILISLIGLWWTLTFILLSVLVALISGIIFGYLVKSGILPDNPNQAALPEAFHFRTEAKNQLKEFRLTTKLLHAIISDGIASSKMILRWIFFGIVLAALIRAFISPENFETYFGATIAGLGLTVLVATILEVCSEGSIPIGADLLTRAKAPGNSFAFLMTGVSTDYTEILVLKEATKSWKIAFFLPLVTLPQILLMAVFLNTT